MWKGYGLVLLSATGFAFIPIFALYAYNSGGTKQVQREKL